MRLITAIILASALPGCASQASPETCSPDHPSTWRAHFEGANGVQIDLTIVWEERTGSVTGTWIHSHWNEPLDYPVDSLSMHGDSLTFVFAPAEIWIRGRCVNQDSITAQLNSAHGDSASGSLWRVRDGST